MKTDEREEARRLRVEEGLSIKRIAAEVGVAPSSVSNWVRDIVLHPEQIAALTEQNPFLNRQNNGSIKLRENGRARRLAYQAKGRKLAQEATDMEFGIGCMLFWAEGSKDKCSVRITNSDPDLLKTFVAFLINQFNILPEKIKLKVHIHEGEEKSGYEQFWLKYLGLPESSLMSPYIKKSGGKRDKKLAYGTAQLRINSVELAHTLYGAIQEFGNFEKPEWL